MYHVLALGSAAVVGSICATMSGSSWRNVALWLAAIFLTATGTTVLNVINLRRPPAAEQLTFWAWAKAVSATFQGLAFSLGTPLLHKSGDALTVVAPAWALLLATANIALVAASFMPVVVLMTLGALLPAAGYLWLQGGMVETAVAVAMVLSLPLAFVLALLTARNMVDLIASRLDIADLLARQIELSASLKAANAERTRFFSAASHDLRQPLQALGFYMTLLYDAKSTEAQRDITGRIADCVEHLDRQFNAILGVASTDRAIETAAPRSVRVMSIFEQVRASILPEAENKRLEVRIVATTTIVRVAPDVLERVLLNLATNAVRYTLSGRVVLGARRRGDGVDLCVADTGIGIAAADRERIFEDFYQAGNPERSPHKGFGLGLAIVQRLCAGMGWSMALRSVPGVGSLFSVRVPYGDAEAVEKGRIEAPRTNGAGLQGVGVVVVDDDPLVREATGLLLSTWKLAHVMVERGEDALTALSSRTPHLTWVVLLDYRLAHGENGLEVAEQIAAEYPDVRTLMLTAESNSDVIAEAERRSLTLLRKPLKPIQLRAALANARRIADRTS